MIQPVRLQLSRARGFDLQALSLATNGLPAVSVARPHRFGNPCRVGMFKGYTAERAVHDHRLWIDRDPMVLSFDGAFGKPPTLAEIIEELGGKNQACWCALGEPCHADYLLEIANK